MTTKVKSWLSALRAQGTRLFILTNSHSDYTNHLLTYAHGPDWKSAFDIIIVNGRKPAFFTHDAQSSPFYEGVDVRKCASMRLVVISAFSTSRKTFALSFTFSVFVSCLSA